MSLSGFLSDRINALRSGDPGKLKMNAHDEIVVWVGPAGDKPKVPSSFNFPKGL